MLPPSASAHARAHSPACISGAIASAATAFSGANCCNSELSFSSGRKSFIVAGASLKRYSGAISPL